MDLVSSLQRKPNSTAGSLLTSQRKWDQLETMVSGGSKTLCAYMSCRQWRFQTRFTGGTSVLFFNRGTEQKKKIFLNVLSTYCTGLTVSVSDPSFFASSPANSSVSLSSPHDLHPLSLHCSLLTGENPPAKRQNLKEQACSTLNSQC